MLDPRAADLVDLGRQKRGGVIEKPDQRRPWTMARVTVQDMRRVAERVVSDHFDTHVLLRIEHLVPDRVFSVVARLRTVQAPSHVPDTFIVKAVNPAEPILASVGVSANPGVDEEIVEATRRAEHDPGDWLALCQGDQNGQGNCLRGDGRLRLHDFGSGGFRHALIEGLPHWITWGCIRRVPDPVMSALDAAYRAVLAESRPLLAAEPEFGQAAADAMTRWHIFHVISRVPDALRGDRPCGPATLRQQTIAWIDAYITWSERQGRTTALASTARRLLQRLRDQWPPHTHQVGYLPAFAGN